MIVIDTNIVMALFVPSERMPLAERLYRRDSRWMAPRLWRSEMRNTLSGALRHGRLDAHAVRETQANAEALLEGNEAEPDSDEVFNLVAASTCTAYDCEFVALALRLGVPLVTCDRQILRDFHEVAVDLIDI